MKRQPMKWEKIFASDISNKELIDNILEKAMAAYSSTLAWKISWTEEPSRLQFMESQRVGHN